VNNGRPFSAQGQTVRERSQKGTFFSLLCFSNKPHVPKKLQHPAVLKEIRKGPRGDVIFGLADAIWMIVSYENLEGWKGIP